MEDATFLSVVGVSSSSRYFFAFLALTLAKIKFSQSLYNDLEGFCQAAVYLVVISLLLAKPQLIANLQL